MAKFPPTGIDVRPEAPAVDAATEAYNKWWTERLAAGFSYGRGPVACMRYGFEAGFAAAHPAPVGEEVGRAESHDLTLSTVLWAAANYITKPNGRDRGPEVREAVLKGLGWAIEQYATNAAPVGDAEEKVVNNEKWHPISTAPKDGTYILLLGDSGYTTTPYRVAVGCWIEGYRDHWINHSNDAFTDDGSPPTHWQPWTPPTL